jgi:hypothetical protein
MTKPIQGAVVFGGYALIGPAIATFSVWTGSGMSDFVYSLVAALWPFWPFAQYESSIGTLQAATLAIMMNVGTFGLVGALVGAVPRSRQRRVLFLFLATCFVLFVFFWLIGEFPAMLLPVTTVCLIIAMPFVIVARARD